MTPWSIVAWLATLSARLSRAWTASSAGSAPSAPIASVASSQSRSRERASRQPAATSERQQAAARVGEVEGQQEGRDRPRPRASAALPGATGGSSRAASRRRSRRSSPFGVPVAERVAQPRRRCRAPRPTSSTCGSRRLARASKSDQRDGDCDAFSETLAPFVGLGDEESGKEEAEIDENPVRLDHAQLDRPRPEGRKCGQKRQAPRSDPPPSRTACRACAGDAGPKARQADHHQPDGQARDVAVVTSKPPPARARPTISASGASSAAVCSNLARDELDAPSSRPELGPTRSRASVSAGSAGIGLLPGCSLRRKAREKSSTNPTLPTRDRKDTARQRRRSPNLRMIMLMARA